MSMWKKTLRGVLILLLGVVALLVILYHGTIYGLVVHFSTWEEDAFRGKPVSELRSALKRKRVNLEPMHARTVPWHVRRHVPTDLRVMKFIKGKEYRWFPIGSAINVGYVLVETNAPDGRVVKVIHGQSIDSL